MSNVCTTGRYSEIGWIDCCPCSHWLELAWGTICYFLNLWSSILAFQRQSRLGTKHVSWFFPVQGFLTILKVLGKELCCRFTSIELWFVHLIIHVMSLGGYVTLLTESYHFSILEMRFLWKKTTRNRIVCCKWIRFVPLFVRVYSIL